MKNFITRHYARLTNALKPMLMGNNANEGAGFVPFTENGPSAEELRDITTSFICSDTIETK
jgi:hypothetical protein